MSLLFAAGSPETLLSETDLRTALFGALESLGIRKRVLAIPPDYTRVHSQAGPLTCFAHQFYQDRLVDVLPALGTHLPMSGPQLEKMFPGLPAGLIRTHRWREDVVTIGHVRADFVQQATENIYATPWPVQLNRLVWEGEHDLILSIGQVVPHEVIGMANFNKNLFIGTGGADGINESHFISAAYGMERIMGRADTPLRRILNEAEEQFCKHLPIVYVLTVIGTDPAGQLITRGLFIGDDRECFERACELSRNINFQVLDHAPKKMVVYLDPEEFHSTWLGNKAIYRTRMAIADGGELIILAPGVQTFGEDRQIDLLIRKYGYRPAADVLQLVESREDLRGNLSAAAHLIHGSAEGRFQITYCTDLLGRDDVERAGYRHAGLNPMLARYNPSLLKDGFNTLPDGEAIFFVRNPALGLWAWRDRMGEPQK